MTNAEKYKSAKERAEAFCDGWMKDHPFKTIGNPVLSAFDWLDLEAEDEKPLPCPFCGGVMSIHESDRGWSYLECLNGCCNYKSGEQGNEDAAIAAHNRVARAVQEKEVVESAQILLCGKEAK